MRLKGGSGNFPGDAYIQRNSFFNNLYAISFRRSNFNQVLDNVIQGGTYGIYFDGSNFDLDNVVDGNNISDNSYGVFIVQQTGIDLTDNYICSNSIYDIQVQTLAGNTGSGNTCENTLRWNDTGFDGCTSYCDTPPEVLLLDPLNNSEYITSDDVNLVCYSGDNFQLVNVTLYHNLSGTWQANQTINISGTFNTTTFTVNVANDTNFIWNCLAYDNKSRGNFAVNNWSTNIIIDTTSPNVNITSPLNQTYNVSSIDFNVTLNEVGSCEYSLDNGITNITMGSSDGLNFNSTNSSIGDEGYKVSFYCEDGVGNENHTGSVDFTVKLLLPNDTHKFTHKNASGAIVAWMGSEGNMVIRGSCYAQSICIASLDSFIIANNSDSTVAFINNSGDLCIEKGDCSDQSVSCNPTRDAFIVRNSSGSNMSYIDFDGDLCLTGRLYENAKI